MKNVTNNDVVTMIEEWMDGDWIMCPFMYVEFAGEPHQVGGACTLCAKIFDAIMPSAFGCPCDTYGTDEVQQIIRDKLLCGISISHEVLDKLEIV